MNKSVLVIDTPNSCVTCPLSYHSEQWREYQCRGREYYRTIDNYEWQKKQTCRDDIKPDWCPLLPLPEKYEIKNILCDRFYDWEYEYGYNACIDEILGGKDDT